LPNLVYASHGGAFLFFFSWGREVLPILDSGALAPTIFEL